METGNLFKPLARRSDVEVFEELAMGREFTLQRICSSGQSTPQGEWYDQPKDEWVVLLSGSASPTIRRPR